MQHTHYSTHRTKFPVAARLKPLLDALEVLTKEHARITRLRVPGADFAALDEKEASVRAQRQEIELTLLARAAHDASPARRELLTNKQAATQLGLVKPNGQPRDSYYKNVAPKIACPNGKTGFVPRERLDAYLEGKIK